MFQGKQTGNQISQWLLSALNERKRWKITHIWLKSWLCKSRSVSCHRNRWDVEDMSKTHVVSGRKIWKDRTKRSNTHTHTHSDARGVGYDVLWWLCLLVSFSLGRIGQGDILMRPSKSIWSSSPWHRRDSFWWLFILQNTQIVFCLNITVTLNLLGLFVILTL